jgi:solute carrier family 13 (sodium-dependent dicarboxylate transporter), member 2/3/5
MIDNILTTLKANPERTIRQGALIAAPAIALTMLLFSPPAGLSVQGWRVATVCILMGLWWMSEAIPLAATALLPLALFPLLGVSSIDTTASSYANPLIFLFLGGFLMATAMVKQNLSRRLAFGLLSRGSLSLPGIIASIMIVTAFLSMWVSNTATTMIMLPIGQSIIAAVYAGADETEKPELAKFSTGLMLAIAYSATIGGMGTLIGTPPNALFAGFMSKTYGIEIEFWRWMMVGVPAVLILLPLTWIILTRFAFKTSVFRDFLKGGFIARETQKLGLFSKGELLVAIVLGLAAFLWIFRSILSDLFPQLQLSDAGIAITAALVLFILPSSEPDRARLLSWEDTKTIRWDVLILFGGGLALAGAISKSGLAIWIGGAASSLAFLPTFLFLLGIFVVIVVLGELASNTAVAAIFLPVAGATALGMGIDPITLTLPIAFAATLGFMLPVATPPNAIVFGSGAIKVHDMLKAGAILDVIGILVVATLIMAIGPYIFAT